MFIFSINSKKNNSKKNNSKKNNSKKNNKSIFIILFLKTIYKWN